MRHEGDENEHHSNHQPLLRAPAGRHVPEFGLFNDTSSLRFGNVPISLNIEARK